MTQEKLNHSMLLHVYVYIYKHLTDALSLANVANEFVQTVSLDCKF